MIRTVTVTNQDMVGLLIRADMRCYIELGFGTADARLLWPDAVRRIFADEWEHLTTALFREA